MAVIKCKMCGGDIELSTDKTFGTCEYCGSTMTLPRIDNEQRAAAFNRGNHFRRIGEFDKALAVYERIVAEDDTDAEAHWCCVLCRFGIEYVEDPETYEYLPTCHRASFDSVLEDVDYLAALEHSDGVTRRHYQRDAAKIAEIQRGILATSQNAEPYDVFISYKELDANGERTRDSILAQDIYYQLTERGWRVFFSRISLEDVPGTQYEPYIFAALNSAKVMVVVGTSAENLNAVWVKNEWSRYLSLMRKDRSKLLLPCYRDMDPYDLPEQLAVLMSYDMGKIGFLQDLIRGIGKVLSADKPKEPERENIKETVVVQHASNTNISALLKRGAMALEDGDWEKADGFFEEVLNHDAECVGAYIGKTLYETKSHSLDEFVKKLLEKHRQDSFKTLYIEKDAEHINASVKKFALPGYLKTEEILPLYDYKLQYSSRVDSRLLQKEQTLKDWDSYKWLARAQRFDPEEKDPSLTRAKRELNNQLERRIKEAQREEEEEKKKLEAAYAAHLAKADEKAKAAYDNAAKRREADYQSYLKSAKYENDIAKLHNTAKLFEALNGYKDSAAQAEGCRSKAAEIKRRQELEAARLKAERAERTKKAAIIIGTVAALAAAVILVITTVIPAMKYSSAQEALEAGNYDEAIAAFTALDDYKDSAQQAEHANNLKIAELERIAAEKAAEAARLEAERQAAIEAEEKARQEAEAARLEAEAAAEQARLEAEEAAEQARLEAEAAAEAARLEAEAEAERARIAAEEAAEKARIEAEEAARLLYESSLEGRYEAAMELMEEGKLPQAAVAFGQIADYKDAKALSLALWDEIDLGDTISAGNGHTVCLMSDGSVKTVGRYGNIGGNGYISVSAGHYSTSATKADGSVYTVRFDTAVSHQVESTTAPAENLPTDIVAESGGYGLRFDGTIVGNHYETDFYGDVSGWTDIIAIEATNNHVVALRTDGTVVASGTSEDGQCDVGEWTDIVAISASASHTLGLKADGTVVATGRNNCGQCNVGEWTGIVAISAGNEHSVGLKSDGTAVAVGDNFRGPCDVSEWTNIAMPGSLDYGRLYRKAEAQLARGNKGAAAISFYKAGKFADARERSMALWDEVAVRDTISAGRDFALGLTAGGKVCATEIYAEPNYHTSFGNSQLNNWRDLSAVSAGYAYTLGLKSNGEVLMGIYDPRYDKDNRNLAEDWTDIVAVSSGHSHAVGLRADGTVLSTGFIASDVGAWTDIVSVSAGYMFTVGLRTDGTVLADGTNTYNQCNVSDWTDIVAISAGNNHTVGLKSDGTVVATGHNGNGQCDVGEWTDIVAISAGVDHTVGLKADGTVVAVGDDFCGQCDVSSWRNVVAVSAASTYTIAQCTDGGMLITGDNNSRSESLSAVKDWTDIKLPTYMLFSLDRGLVANIAMTLFKSGDVKGSMKLWDELVARNSVAAKAWGTVTVKVDGTVAQTIDIDYSGFQKYGYWVPPKDLGVSSWRNIIEISAGDNHIVGLKSDGTVLVARPDNSYEFPYYSQRDVGNWRDLVSVSAGDIHTLGLKADGTVVAVGQNVDGRCDVSEWTDIVAISAGNSHSVGLRSDGTVVAVGGERYGQCDVSDWTDIVAVSAGGTHTAGLKADGTVVAVGSNIYGQCNVGDWTDIVAISAGVSYTVGMKADGTLVVVGGGRRGEGDISEWTDIVTLSSKDCIGLKADGTVVTVNITKPINGR